MDNQPLKYYSDNKLEQRQQKSIKKLKSKKDRQKIRKYIEKYNNV